MRKASRRKKRIEKTSSDFKTPSKPLSLDLDKKHIDIICTVMLFAFGTYLSILYFGHQVIPNPDFPAFFETGQQILSFQIPSSFKRLPGLGVLQVLLSYLMPGPHPELTAGWVLNGLLYAGTAGFLFLLSKRILTSSAILFSLILMINPLALTLMRNPLVETSLIFFFVLTFYLIFRGTRWMYLPAMAASLLRYEGALLIVICFIVDFLSSKGVRSRLWSFARAAITSTPLTLWLIGMMTLRKTGTSVSSLPYIRNYSAVKATVVDKFLTYLWDNSVSSLLLIPNDNIMPKVFMISKILLVVGIALSVFFCIYKKQWKVLAIFGFLAGYVGLHATRTYTLPRYCLPAVWAAVLLAWYGFNSVWEWIKEKNRLPFVLIVLQVIIGTFALIAVFQLFKLLPKIAAVSRRSVSVPYVTLAAACTAMLIQIMISGSRKFLSHTVLLAAMSLMVFSNQFTLARMVGNGTQDIEFKKLADWYLEHAESGDKMLTAMTYVVRLYLPEHKQNIGPLAGPEKTIQEFIQSCYKRNIKYVVWDSREGLTGPNNKYYRQGNLQKVALLGQPRDVGPFKYIDKIVVNRRQYLYIFELQSFSEFQHQMNQSELKKSGR